ncbi:GMC family oxidoreductase N-terminal domain-containing protein [Ramlibacter sp. AW1]|uniref:GMC family oxidoreductase N-terminal domain-containing protein n=1 Tax=Ramlibacter aurantiacus TaxID=2801330 RepID=A0A936ZRA5_9BURK|nr:GMC family oxidoreductase N-terminal domain-containing protein [Ramlibacter aurantiacus]MBL0419234.1 GMC family oxidoreductase N-terminal domain-containing protein [Ramlibacter aurantiacus]
MNVTTRLQADVVVVGAGSAGCAIAGRLSEDPNLQVVLVEAGGADRNPWIHVPIGYFKTIGSDATDWRFLTEPEKELAGRRIAWPRGKVLGGSSSINGMLYVRGHAADYDGWRDAGNTGWGWSDVLPFFRKAESQCRGADDWHGADGPLTVSDIAPDPLSDAFVQAMAQHGVRTQPDFNRGDSEGAGYFQMTTRKGRRQSAARAYLAPARHRRNLRIVTGATVSRVEIAGGRAVAVECTAGIERFRVGARREVVVACGALQSPVLLQRSGIGPGGLLQSMGIAVLRDLPGVGANLQDHLQVRLVLRCNRPLTLNDLYHRPLRRLSAGWTYLTRRSGPLVTGIHPAGAFVRVHPLAQRPDVQIHFALVSFERLGGPLDRFSGFSLSACVLYPHSRGSIRIASPDPATPAHMRAGYLDDERDRDLIVRSVPWMRQVAAQPALARLVAEEVRPGPACATPEQVLAYVRQTAFSVHHQAGTCAMGRGAQAVVDERLRVHGVDGLRVADASIMPTLVGGNTNAPSIMIGEKAADLIRADLKGAA